MRGTTYVDHLRDYRYQQGLLATQAEMWFAEWEPSEGPPTVPLLIGTS